MGRSKRESEALLPGTGGPRTSRTAARPQPMGRITSSHHSKDVLRLVLHFLFQGVGGMGWGVDKDSAGQGKGWRQKGAHVNAGDSQ